MFVTDQRTPLFINYSTTPPMQGPPVPPNLSQRLAGVIKILRRAIETYGVAHPASLPIILLVSFHLGRVVNRFASLARRVRAGTAAIRKRPPATAPRPAATTPPKPTFPRRFFWLLQIAPGHHTGAGRAQLRHLLADPEMAAFLEAAPQAARLFRPLCRILGIAKAADLPAALFPERPKRPPKPRAPRPPKEPRAPRVRRKPRPIQIYPTQTWQEREALDRELAEWHANRRPYVPPKPSKIALAPQSQFQQPEPRPRPPPWRGNMMGR
jgi:hypothetical protein